jgi:hypothetical protein
MARALLLSAVAVILLAGARSASACTCAGAGPPCQAAWTTQDVFVGRVLSIADVEHRDDAPLVSRLVRVHATEMFLGRVTGEIELGTGRGGGDCGFSFAVGETYLIYAHRNSTTGRLSTGICTRTALVARAGEDLDYLRGLKTSSSTLGRITGRARFQRVQPNGSTETTATPFANVRVLVEGLGKRYEARTDANGEYELRVPVGEFSVRAEVPAGQYAVPWWPNVTIRDPRGCAEVDIGVRWDGRLAGRTIGVDGAVVPFFAVELVPADQIDQRVFHPSHVARANEHGVFEFRELPPGAYYLGFDTYRVPVQSSRTQTRPSAPRVIFNHPDGERRRIEVPPGGRVTVEDFVLPAESKVVQVSGLVFDDRGGLAAGAQVDVRDVTSDISLRLPVTTGLDGRFHVALVAGRQYRLSVDGYEGGRFVSRAESQTFTLTTAIRDLTFILRRNDE